jgi:hypothetical protein
VERMEHPSMRQPTTCVRVVEFSLFMGLLCPTAYAYVKHYFF